MITVTTNALHQIKKLITSRENIPAGIKVGINTKGCSDSHTHLSMLIR